MNGQYDSNKRDIFNFNETAKGAYLEDVLVHNARLYVLQTKRYAQCLENGVRVYAEFFANKSEYRAAASNDFKACVDAHIDMQKEGLL